MLQSIICLALMLPVCSSQPEAVAVSEVVCEVLFAPTEPAEDMLPDKQAAALQPPAEDLETCRAGDENSSTREVAPLEKQEIGKTSTDESMPPEENAQSEQPTKTVYLHEEKRPKWLSFLDSYWKWGVSLLVLLLCFVLHCRRPPRYSTGCPDNRCPRCGWRLDEGQEICRNCNTRL